MPPLGWESKKVAFWAGGSPLKVALNKLEMNAWMRSLEVTDYEYNEVIAGSGAADSGAVGRGHNVEPGGRLAPGSCYYSAWICLGKAVAGDHVRATQPAAGQPCG